MDERARARSARRGGRLSADPAGAGRPSRSCWPCSTPPSSWTAPTTTSSIRQAADEALEYLAAYLQRLKGQTLEQRARGHELAWSGYARHEKWPKQVIRSLQGLSLTDYGVGEEGEA